MMIYCLCIFIYLTVSPNPTFGNTTWQPAFDITAGNTKTWTTTVIPTMPSISIQKPEAPKNQPNCDLLLPVSCVLKQFDYFSDVMNRKNKGSIIGRIIG